MKMAYKKLEKIIKDGEKCIVASSGLPGDYVAVGAPISGWEFEAGLPDDINGGDTYWEGIELTWANKGMEEQGVRADAYSVGMEVFGPRSFSFTGLSIQLYKKR